MKRKKAKKTVKKLKKIKKKVKKVSRGKSLKKKVKNKGPKPTGKITHYFSKIKVAVIKITSDLEIGDTVRIIGGASTEFLQKVASMQKDHKTVRSAKKGSSIGIKIKKPVREGYKIYKA